MNAFHGCLKVKVIIKDEKGKMFIAIVVIFSNVSTFCSISYQLLLQNFFLTLEAKIPNFSSLRVTSDKQPEKLFLFWNIRNVSWSSLNLNTNLFIESISLEYFVEDPATSANPRLAIWGCSATKGSPSTAFASTTELEVSRSVLFKRIELPYLE